MWCICLDGKEEKPLSLLRSCSYGTAYGKDGITEDVLNLFIDLAHNPSKQIEFASEIVDAGMSGRIRLDGSFNIDAYEAGIRKTNRLYANSQRKKQVSADMSGAGLDDLEFSETGVLTSDYVNAHLSEEMTDAYDELLDNYELEYAIDTLKMLREDMIRKAGVDILYTIKQALSGATDARKVLRDVCERFELVAEQIKVVLGSGRSFYECFGDID